MPRRLAGAIVAFALVAPGVSAHAAPTDAASPASATPLAIARCIWVSLPNTTRAALVASGPTIEDIGRAVAGMNPALMALAQSQCPQAADAQIQEAAKDAWAGTVMTNWAQGELAARYGVTAPALATAWSRVTPAQRRQIASGFDQAPEAVRANVAGFAAELRLTDPAALDLLSAWAIAEIRLSTLN
jgi:hypothetical protein